MSISSTSRALVRVIFRGGPAARSRAVVVEAASCLAADIVEPLLARCRPIVGTSAYRGGSAPVARDGGRRVFVAGDLETSIWNQRGHDADELVRLLCAVGARARRDDSDAGPEVTIADTSGASAIEAQLAAAVADHANPWYTERDGVTRLVGQRPGSDPPTSDAASLTVWRHHRIGARRTTGRSTEIRIVGGDDRAGPVATTLVPDVDVVVTWVDHADERWRREFDRHVHRDLHPGAALPARFENNDEIRFALRSIWQNCGWVRHIHVVTAGQRPTWLIESEQLSVVDHTEFLPPTALPTFNSHAIESGLHRIPGLAERFVYFNDDFFVGRPIDVSDLFGADRARPQVFSIGAMVDAVPADEVGQLQATRATDDLLRQLHDFDGTEVLHHAPYANLRSLTELLEHNFPTEFSEVAHSRFRSPMDLSIAASLGPWYAVAIDRADLADPEIDYVSLGHPLAAAQLRVIRRRPPTFWCANRTDRGRPGEHAESLAAVLSALYPTPAPWETT